MGIKTLRTQLHHSQLENMVSCSVGASPLVDPFSQWWHQKFFVGGIEGAKCDSEGQKSKNLPKMADFGHFFLLTGVQVDAESPTGG